MARRKSRKRRGGVSPLTFLDDVDTNAMAANSLNGARISSVVSRKAYLISMDMMVTMDTFAESVGRGPFVVGVAHSDYTDTEIEEWIETTGSWDRGDLIAREKQRRKCRKIGVFAEGGALNDGKPIRVKLGFALEEGDTLAIWVYNQGAAAQEAALTLVEFNGTIWARFS